MFAVPWNARKCDHPSKPAAAAARTGRAQETLGNSLSESSAGAEIREGRQAASQCVPFHLWACRLITSRRSSEGKLITMFSGVRQAKVQWTIFISGLVPFGGKSAKTDVDRARGLRNGLMIALLALCPVRIKNFAALELGRTFKKVEEHWWLTLPATETKTGRADERRVPTWLTQYVEIYLNEGRQVLCGSQVSQAALWVSCRTRQMTANNMGTLISRLTRETLGVNVYPHLFRTAAASTAAAYGTHPGLASALLNHTDPRITEDHYNRAGSANATHAYAEITRTLLLTELRTDAKPRNQV
jgi:Phage integrase family